MVVVSIDILGEAYLLIAEFTYAELYIYREFCV